MTHEGGNAMTCKTTWFRGALAPGALISNLRQHREVPIRRKRFAMNLLGSFAIAAGLKLHRTILFTRARRPHCAARRCGSGTGSQQCATAGALALALALAFWPSDAAAHTCDAPFRTDLLTARGIDVGDVTVCNDDEFLTINYETTWPWCVLRTNLHVASDLAGIPKFRLLGTPNFLRFDFIEDVDCGVPTPVEIPLADIDDDGVVPGETVTIAARALVEGEGPDGTHPQCLLGDKCVAWGEGPRFRPRLPAMYFEYTVQSPPPACPCAGAIDQVLAELFAGGGAVAGTGVSFDTYFLDGTCIPSGSFRLFDINPDDCHNRATEPRGECGGFDSVPPGGGVFTDFFVRLAPGQQQACIDYTEGLLATR
jgi:hypothetical protein